MCNISITICASCEEPKKLIPLYVNSDGVCEKCSSLQDELDFVRREYCIAAAIVGKTTPFEIAMQQGWNIFNPTGRSKK